MSNDTATSSDPTIQPSLPTDPRQILSVEDLQILNDRSNWQGWVQLTGHLAIMAMSGYLWATQMGHWVAIPALIIYGFSFASMFAPMHECGHRTAFANHQVNDVISWFAGLLSFYNSTFYRRYHKWHHRYTQLPGKDPELSSPKPSNWSQYLLEVSGLPWWFGKVQGHVKVAFGQVEDYPFIPETARVEVIQSTRLQLAVYALAIALSVGMGQPWFFLYWLLPLAVGQPLLRAILLSEHTGCSHDENPLTNTRTTYTVWPIRFLMWNMPFHAEHHLYPSIPFHMLPDAHQKLRSHFTQIGSGYLNVQKNLILSLGKTDSSENTLGNTLDQSAA